jgi:glucokinase
MDIQEIFKIYGKEKGIEMVNEYFVIEINALRKNLNLDEVSLDNDLILISQEQAVYLDTSSNSNSNLLLQKRIKNH